MAVRTAVIGSYPQPDWLVDKEALRRHGVPRVRTPDIWRVPEPWLEEAMDDATLVAIREQGEAGLDVVTDGEIRRESYSNRFANALGGIDLSNPHIICPGSGLATPVARVTGPVVRHGPVELEDMRFLRRHTRKLAKITLPGPFTMAHQVKGEHYGDPRALAWAFAEAVNAEALELQAAGADVIQLDEPWLRQDLAGAEAYAVDVIDRALQGITVTTAVHLCFGYAAVVTAEKPKAYGFLSRLADSTVKQISFEAAQAGVDLGILADLSSKVIELGVLDLADPAVESPDTVARRLEAALAYLPLEQLMAAPDCGMKYLPRDTARGKLEAMCKGAALVG